jgi:hypothetical protein
MRTVLLVASWVAQHAQTATFFLPGLHIGGSEW